MQSECRNKNLIGLCSKTARERKRSILDFSAFSFLLQPLVRATGLFQRLGGFSRMALCGRPQSMMGN